MRWGDYVIYVMMVLNTSAGVLYAAQGHWRQAGYWFAALQLNYWLVQMR